MDSATFRTNFPEFADVLVFSDAQVNYWLGIGVKMLRVEAWDDLIDHGLELFTAHHLVLARGNKKAAAVGGAMGVNSGALASKSIDKVSASYDTGSGTIEGQGHWNLTTYGTQFIQLSRMVGIGGAQAFGSGDAYAPALGLWQDGYPRAP